MKTRHTLFVDQPLADGEKKSDLFQYADQVEREGWIDTSLQFALALCLALSLVICAFRVATPVAVDRSPRVDSAATAQPAPTTLAVGGIEAKAAPAL